MALIGTTDDDPNGEDAGAAYVYETGGDSWSQQAKLFADDGDAGDRFGRSVGLSYDGSTAIVGAYKDKDPNGEDAGSAYVFEAGGGTWSQRSKLVPNDGNSNDWFGWSVAAAGDGGTFVVGASGEEDPNGDGAGAAYVYE